MGLKQQQKCNSEKIEKAASVSNELHVGLFSATHAGCLCGSVLSITASQKWFRRTPGPFRDVSAFPLWLQKQEDWQQLS